MPSEIDNIIIQVRSRLQENGIKLWLPPYYHEEIGPVETELEELANDFSAALGITLENCKSALSELQDGALNKLRARKEFETSGVATFKIRAIKSGGNATIFDIKAPITDTGKILQEKIAAHLQVHPEAVRIICSGKVLKSEITLLHQDFRNNQQLMALVSNDNTDGSNENLQIYDRVKQAKEDAELIVESKGDSFFAMEDQDGNAVYLPPEEKKSVIMALALYEKGRSALKKELYNEALILFLEADQLFSSCNSNLLESVDNYALLNLDIVWCYLCLKSVTHLPDAQRRLTVCEQNFRKSYGENLDRVVALKGNTGNEKALIMRLHLLQGVLLFHQNQRNQAHEKLSLAENELHSLKVNEEDLLRMLEMGYDLRDSRIALRACNGNIEQAITFVTDRKEKKRLARKRAKEENEIDKKFQSESDNWVNPRSMHTLVNMGFQEDFAYAALKKAKNDLTLAIDILENNQSSLAGDLPKKNVVVDDKLVEQLVAIGFNPEMAKIALESVLNNSEEAIELLLKMQNEGNYSTLIESLSDATQSETNKSESRLNQPGTSKNVITNNDVKNKIKKQMEALKAYKRFTEDVSTDGDEYLDLPLLQEESVLHEYKKMLEN